MAAYRLGGEALDLVTAYENELWDIGQLPITRCYGALDGSWCTSAKRSLRRPAVGEPQGRRPKFGRAVPRRTTGLMSSVESLDDLGFDAPAVRNLVPVLACPLANCDQRLRRR